MIAAYNKSNPKSKISGSSRGPDKAVTNVSFNEAYRFINWLNTSQGHQAAYKVTSDDANSHIKLWDKRDAWQPGGENLFRHKDAKYFLPSENEWYKAAYFKSDGGGYTTYATGNSVPDGIDFSGDTNYDSVFLDGFNNNGPLAAGGGAEENNGTYDMGGNVLEWGESAFDGTLDDPNESRVLRGGDWEPFSGLLQSSGRTNFSPDFEDAVVGFRVASVSAAVAVVPEPSSVGLLVIGAMGCVLRRKRG